MKFSERWLRDWISPAWDTATLCHRLTMAGLEVDAVSPVAASFNSVVVGAVMTVAPHPDAERLKVCRVDVGQGESIQIVCGAANVAVGVRVPAALVGAELPGGLSIKKAKLRGVESSGMLCSAKELGLAESSTGLMILPADAPVGMDIRDYLHLDDVSIELGLTPNRGDCLSVVGIAREVAALSGGRIQDLASESVAAVCDSSFPIAVEAPAQCPRYLGRVIRSVDPKATTPLWMQERLRRSGLRSINALVDVTNYVLLELGQPMHAFDLDKLQSGICVRSARENEVVTLLDGQTLSLQADTLVIADASGPVALAGVMGGGASAVGDETQHIFLESAHFTPAAVAGRARRYGLHTDSSHRFERGVDPELPRRAMERATALILAIAGGEAGPVLDVTHAAYLSERAPVALRARQLRRLMGTDLERAEVARLLKGLGMRTEETEEGWRIMPPSNRFDIAIEADVVEEVARMVGYDQIPTQRPAVPLVVAGAAEAQVDADRLRQIMVDRGYQEAITYSFVSPEQQRGLDPAESAIPVANPIAADMAVMRTNLWPGLMQAFIHNRNRQQERIRLFEIGHRFRLRAGVRVEEQVISGLAAGGVYPEQWGAPTRALDLFDLKADVESLLELSGMDYMFSPATHPALHPGQSAEIRRADGKVVGRMGALHPQMARALDVSDTVWLFELELEAITQGRLPRFRELSRFPAIRRDLAVVVDENITAQQVRECIVRAAGELLQGLQLFDVYQGKGVDSRKKSLALGLTLQDYSRTLTDVEIDALIDRVVGELASVLGASLRE